MSANEQWEAFCAAELRQRRCPDSGLPLHDNGEAGPGCLSCGVCDCFGYPFDDPRIGS